ncbi:MAG: DUF998 domain-containing protein [Oscillospiraceae bacterium]|nr:DUF998 domain-containing protein [Oscillospiraceae bacterium]
MKNCTNGRLLRFCGLLGVISLLSYTAAVIFSPLAYPDYNWLAQAVSDLSADSAPSRILWNQLSSLYGPCGIVSIMAVCVAVEKSRYKLLKIGIYLFAAMEWVSSVGYTMFPLSDAGTPNGFQNVMHLVVTGAVVVLSIASLVVIFIGTRKNELKILGNLALAAVILMTLGAIGTGAMPKEYFGIPERFSVFAAAGFNAILGIWLFRGKLCEK